MADKNIVSGIFGLSPEMYTMARDIKGQQEAAVLAAQPGTMMNPSLAPLYAQAAQQGQMIGRGIGGLLGVEDPELAKIRDVQQMRTQFDVSTPAGLRQFAQALGQKGYSDLAIQAAAEADKRELTQAQTVRALREPGMQSFERLLSSGKYTPASIAKFKDSQNPADLVLVKGADGGDGVGKLSTAEKAIDTKFGKEYADFYAGGGIANLNKNLEELDRAISIIEKAKEDEVSGKLIGLSDKAGTLAYTHRKAADVKDIIGGVAQSNLRQILGGQFAQKEGEALLARQYDTAQSKSANLKRLKALRKQAANTIQSKSAAANYFEENGTLKGFKATQSVSEDSDPLGLRK
jgi:hypothetical protein